MIEEHRVVLDGWLVGVDKNGGKVLSAGRGKGGMTSLNYGKSLKVDIFSRHGGVGLVWFIFMGRDSWGRCPQSPEVYRIMATRIQRILLTV